MIWLAFVISQGLALLYFVLMNLYQTAMLTGAYVEMRRHRRTIWNERLTRLLASRATPSVSVVAPAYNEATTVAASVRALLTISYPGLEIVVVNDGSRDATLDVLRSEFDLAPVRASCPGTLPSAPVRGLYRSRRHRGLVVVDKENGGKADALNAGIDVATGDLIAAIDADTLIEPDAFLRIVRPFITDERTVAAGATIRVVNGSRVRDGRVVEVRAPRKLLPGIQTIEYLRAFLFGRLGWNLLGGNLIVSGAFGMFRRDSVLAVGGYCRDTVGEDMDLVIRLRRHGIETGGPSAVTFVPDPIAWTEVPESSRVLGRQRERWQRGLTDVLRRHRGLMLNPRYGRVGLVGMPYHALFELFGPVLEVVGLVGLAVAFALGVVDVPYAVAFFVLAYGWGVLLSTTSLVLHQWSSGDPFPLRDVPHLIGYALAENLGYRQLTIVWRLRGTWRYLRGRTDWGHMVRVGFEAPAAPPA
jgi:cellulose synthase/poly-beta-1,6-N-acetylglucosamine synthase-like glycosyltransferase